MVMKWAEVTQTPDYQKADGNTREAMRNGYFMDVVAPSIPTEHLQNARDEFDADTQPTFIGKAKEAISNGASTVADTVSKGINLAGEVYDDAQKREDDRIRQEDYARSNAVRPVTDTGSFRTPLENKINQQNLEAQQKYESSPVEAASEIARQGYAGLTIDAPAAVNKAGQAFSPDGSAAEDFFKKGAEYWESNAKDFEPNTRNKGVLVNKLASGARAIPLSGATMAAYGVSLLSSSVAAPIATAAGIAALFGGSQFTDTYEKSLQAGLPKDQAFKAGLLTGSIEGLGETAGDYMGGKFMVGLGHTFAKTLGTKEALSAATSPRWAIKFGKDFIENAAVQSGTEFGQNFGETAVENRYGISNDSPIDQGKQGAATALAMSLMMMPGAVVGHKHQANVRKLAGDLIADQSAPIDERAKAAEFIRTEMEHSIGKEAAKKWHEGMIATLGFDQADTIKKQAAQEQPAEQQTADTGDLNAATILGTPEPEQPAQPSQVQPTPEIKPAGVLGRAALAAVKQGITPLNQPTAEVSNAQFQPGAANEQPNISPAVADTNVLQPLPENSGENAGIGNGHNPVGGGLAATGTGENGSAKSTDARLSTGQQADSVAQVGQPANIYSPSEADALKKATQGKRERRATQREEILAGPVHPDAAMAEHYAQKTAALGMTQQQAEAVKPETGKDAMTGLYSDEELRQAMHRAQKTGGYHYVEFDLFNLGGANKALGANARADEVIKQLGSAVASNFDGQIVSRRGGGRFGVLVKDGFDTQSAIDNAKREAQHIAKANKLDQIDAPKVPGSKGIALYGASTPVDHREIKDIIQDVQDNTRAQMPKGEQNVNGSQTWKTWLAASTGQAAGVSRSIAGRSGQVAGEARPSGGGYGAALERASSQGIRESESRIAPDNHRNIIHADRAQRAKLTEQQQAATEPHTDRDTLTGFYTANDVRKSISRALDQTKKDLKPIPMAGIDVSNLGGMTEALGRETADIIFRNIAHITAEHVQAIKGADLIPFRNGGDEFLFIVPGATVEQVQVALSKSAKAVQDYIHEIGIQDLPHAKYLDNLEKRGSGIYYGTEKLIDSDIQIPEYIDRLDAQIEKAKSQPKSKPAEVQAESPVQSVPAGTAESVKSAIEQLIAKRKIAGQFGLAPNLDAVIRAAKAYLKGEKFNKSLFTKTAAKFQRHDAGIATILRSVVDAVNNVVDNGTVSAPKERKAATDLIQRIKQLGGISSEYAEDFGAKDAGFNVRSAFKKGGESPDFIASQLKDEGYPISEDDLIGGLAEFVRRYVNGERSFKAVNIESAAMSERDDRAFQDLIPDAEKHGIDWRKFKSPDDLYVAITVAEDALTDAEQAAHDIALGDNDITLDDVKLSSEAEVNAWLSGENDARRNAEGVAGAAIGEQAQGNQVSAQGTGVQGEAQSGAGGGVLKSYTNSEVIKREAAAKAAEEAANKEAPAKNVTADQVDMFATQGGLFNSNRTPSPQSLQSADILAPDYASSIKSVSDGMRTATKILGDIPHANSIRIHGFDSLDIKSKHMVLTHMLGLFNDKQVLRAIIEAVPVDVMNSLIGSKWSADKLLHDPSMLTHRLSISSDISVTKSVAAFVNSLFSNVITLPASNRTKESGLDQKSSAIDFSGNGSQAVKADSVDNGHVEVTINGKTDTVNVNPTDAQKEAGTYKKGHFNWNGLDITIENPAGSERSGTDSDGEKWSVTMPASYGYLKRTTGADGDHVDVYIGKHHDSDRVFIIDQQDHKSGKFDEHKVMLGFDTLREAERTYKAGFSDGKGAARMGAVSVMSLDEFKTWLADGDTTKPVEQVDTQQVVAKPEIIKVEDIPSGLKITIEDNSTGKTRKKLVDAKRAMQIANQRVEKYEALIKCMS